MHDAPWPAWAEGRLVPARALPRDGSAALGCYTTARVEAARPRFAERHVERLRRDAQSLGLDPPSAASCREALATLAAAAFPHGTGIVRLALLSEGGGRARLVGTARPLGSDPPVLDAVLSPQPHPGPGPAPGVKLTPRAALDRAAEQARRWGADEAILADAEGWVVEGARTNLAGVDASGSLWTPPLARGAVAGLARALVLESLAELREADVSEEALASCRELVALNAVRGALAVVRLQGRPVGSGRPGPFCARLRRILTEAG